MGSVTANLVEHSKVIPIWIVDGRIDSTKLLLAADGSYASLRALDHLAFILSGSTNHRISILHIRPRFRDFCKIDLEPDTVERAQSAFLDEDQRCMDDFYPRALKILEKNGISKERLEFKSVDGNLSIPRMIIAYAHANDFGTIVMGRSGRSRGMFTGSVSYGLLQKAAHCALWVVP